VFSNEVTVMNTGNIALAICVSIHRFVMA